MSPNNSQESVCPVGIKALQFCEFTLSLRLDNHSTKFDDDAASEKAIEKDIQAKGLGHPAAVGDEPTVAHRLRLFKF
ncbi:hypothetical protein BT96DRAFT_998364 [Gymnopus androsaceus JB14]|uniref:Uncharacterized protein n=1 Tax=Gymnopus androsaceus JB14 TaxID=1447944 RepID=A0A6A4HBS5_9AGAR|nr:hypothetical protein BT96DRAFT_998364 [Gymnopus androsaceus JB14]